MGWLIGLDEAGYGPNLGPLVITATLWETPEDPAGCDGYELLNEVIAAAPNGSDNRLQIADSKVVYQPGKGLRNLERTVLAALKVCGHAPTDFHELVQSVQRLVSEAAAIEDACEPWFERSTASLPVECDLHEVLVHSERWAAASAGTGFHLRAIQSDVVFTPRFNRLADEWGNKSHVLSQLGLRLIESFWQARREESLLVICDKHGGRNCYHELLLAISEGAMVITRQEGRDLSRYSVGPAEFRFQTRAESHLPTALASMVSKYVRETAMREFNAWWKSRNPGLKPTAGYPQDAKRFRRDVAADLQELGIPEAVFWRSR